MRDLQTEKNSNNHILVCFGHIPFTHFFKYLLCTDRRQYTFIIGIDLNSFCFQGLACGTLVYVVFFEVWRQDRTGLVQFVCSLLGFTLMVALEAIVEIGMYYGITDCKYHSAHT